MLQTLSAQTKKFKILMKKGFRSLWEVGKPALKRQKQSADWNFLPRQVSGFLAELRLCKKKVSRKMQKK
jgi:hypothetical protein